MTHLKIQFFLSSLTWNICFTFELIEVFFSLSIHFRYMFKTSEEEYQKS